MKPPMCCICGNDFGPDEGGLVYFRKRESDLEWDKRMEEPGMAGHPPYAEWFCGKHYEIALEYRHLTLPEAFAAIKKHL